MVGWGEVVSGQKVKSAGTIVENAKTENLGYNDFIVCGYDGEGGEGCVWAHTSSFKSIGGYWSLLVD